MVVYLFSPGVFTDYYLLLTLCYATACLWAPSFKTRQTNHYEISSIYSNIIYYNTCISIIYETMTNIYIYIYLYIYIYIYIYIYYNDKYEIQLLIKTCLIAYGPFVERSCGILLKILNLYL